MSEFTKEEAFEIADRVKDRYSVKQGPEKKEGSAANTLIQLAAQMAAEVVWEYHQKYHSKA